ncbi:hypothetical protein AJ79_00484 [Helicocarpus griseus UAMH5409]|uniref:Zn(2)-C6 fungal-type domain-containing protein n=1 Tax=Helicocarpus griseus UAMH5409 TaxID=1447875 RepID=A0A2B7YAY2_9EURO|nr:hypothetical protein AJ79_00484 [Helicocarpus griseus UAMH5409]
MHSIRSAGRPLPFTPFGQAHGPSSDPLRFSLNLSLSDTSFPLSLRAPYLSPPMSGSPSPENRFDPLRGDRRRKRSHSPIPTTAHGAAQPLLSYAEPPTRAPGPDVLLSDSRRLSTGHHSGMSIIGLPAIEDTQLRPTLQTGALLPPRTNPLPPRSTRRAKAHVASACVNCKRKHLGCDSARPCRRCISAGKETTCVDVVHKRRGRPPLKAEEGPLRPYEPTFNHPETSRPQPHSTSPISQFYSSHRRASSSREIRPSTELRLSRTSSDIGGEYGRPRPSPAASNAHMWAPPTPSRAIPPSPPISSSFPGQAPLSIGSSQHSGAHNTPLFSPERRASAYFLRDVGDISRPMPPFRGEKLPPNQSPRQYQHHAPAPPPPSGAPYFSGPGSPHGPLSSPPLSASSSARNFPFSGPGQSQILLPPLKPSTTGPEFESSQSSQRVPSAPAPSPAPPPSLPSLQTGRQPPSRVDQIQELEDSRPHPTQPPFQPAPFSPGSSGPRLLDSYRPAPLPPPAQPQSQPQPQQQPSLRRQSSFSAADTWQPAQQEKTPPTNDPERETESRPAKRQKMALGDMVND